MKDGRRTLSRRGLRRAIKALGWTHAEAARRLNADPRSVRRWLEGKTKVPGPAVVALELYAKHGPA